MTHPSKFQRIIRISTQTHNPFSFKTPLLNGKTSLTNATYFTKAYPHLFSILRSSKTHQSLPTAKMAHSFILRSGFESDLFVLNNLLSAYCSCSLIPHALRLFDGMPQRDAVSWNTVISEFISSGQFREAFCFFSEMTRVGIRPTQSTFASVLVACTEMAGFECLRQVHCFSLKSGFTFDCCVGNSLLKGYSSLGEFSDLWKVSDEMCGLDEISIEILLRGCSRIGMQSESLKLLRYCSLVGKNLSPFALSTLISLCSGCGCADHGIQIHGYVIKLGLDSDVSVANSLITMYSRSYSLEDAKFLFDWLGSRDIVTWNSMIGGFAYNGAGDAGLAVFQRLLSSGLGMNESTFSSFLSCCATVSVLNNAKKAHALILKLRDPFHQGIDNITLTMYCRSKSVESAVAAFETMESRDMVSFNLMMSLYRTCGCYKQSIRIFFEARSCDVGVDELMLSGVVYNCTRLGFLELGQQIHGFVIRIGFGKVLHLKNSLLELYSQVGRTDDMERIFYEEGNEIDLFAWNTMLMGYAHCGLFDKTMKIWKEMARWSVKPNEFSYSALLDACGWAIKLQMGEEIHGQVQKKGLVFDTALMNSFITMYSNCGMMEKALSVFEETSWIDMISWNAMVSGYSQNGFAEESIKFYKLMNENGVETNHMTFASICMSCAMLSELKLGSQLHSQVIKRAFELDILVSNSFITMYAKCGEISDSRKLFRGMLNRDMVTWNSMITALADYGLGREALNVFENMKHLGVRPNIVTFIGILSACSRSGLVLEACDQFNSMCQDYGIAPNEEHYACMVDILCRAGKLKEARDLIESMPFEHCSLVWRMLLSACRVNGNVKLGEIAAKRILDIEPRDPAPYVLLSDLYASIGDRENKAEVRRVMEQKGVKKEVGCSWILS